MSGADQAQLTATVISGVVAALAVTVALVITYLEHRHRDRAAFRDVRRASYIALMHALGDIQVQVAGGRSHRPRPESIEKLQRALSELRLVAPPDIYKQAGIMWASAADWIRAGRRSRPGARVVFDAELRRLQDMMTADIHPRSRPPSAAEHE